MESAGKGMNGKGGEWNCRGNLSQVFLPRGGGGQCFLDAENKCRVKEGP